MKEHTHYNRIKATSKQAQNDACISFVERELARQKVNYASKQDLKKYIDKLWDKYQYPWPEDWLKEDRFL